MKRTQRRAMFARQSELIRWGAGIESEHYVNVLREDFESEGFVRDVCDDRFDFGDVWEPPSSPDVPDMTFEEIAVHFQLSKHSISLIEKKALEKLRWRLRSEKEIESDRARCVGLALKTATGVPWERSYTNGKWVDE